MHWRPEHASEDLAWQKSDDRLVGEVNGVGGWLIHEEDQELAGQRPLHGSYDGHGCTDEVHRHISEAPDRGLNPLYRTRESRLTRILRIEEVNVEIFDPIPNAKVLERGTLTECDSEEPATIRCNELGIPLEEVLLLGPS